MRCLLYVGLRGRRKRLVRCSVSARSNRRCERPFRNGSMSTNDIGASEESVRKRLVPPRSMKFNVLCCPCN